MNPAPELGGNPPIPTDVRAPGESQGDRAASHVTLRLIFLTLVAVVLASGILVAVGFAGLPTSGLTGEIIRVGLTTVILVATLHLFVVWPLVLRVGEARAQVRQGRRRERDFEGQFEALNRDAAASRQKFESEIAGRQRLEAEVQHLSAEMDRRVAERTAELDRQAADLRTEALRWRQTAETLRESERRLRQWVDTADEGIWVLNAQGRTTFVNQHGAERLGCEASAILGKPFAEFVRMDDFPPEKAPFGEELAELPISFEARMRRLAGGEFWARGSLLPISGENGGSAGTLILFRDATKQRKLEAQRVREQRLESASVLAHGLARELSTSMTTILLSLETLQLSLGPEDQELVAIVRNGAERVAAFLKEMLTFARGIEGERVVLQPARLLREVVDTLRETFPRNVDVIGQTGEQLWTVLGDAMQLKNLLVRLCVYARDSMPSGGMLRLRARNLRIDENHATDLGLRAGAYVEISVQDSGPAIPAALSDRIFEPFFHARPRTSGTGLSLPAALGIAKSHGGTIHVESGAEQGAVFHIYLPAELVIAGASGTSCLNSLERGVTVLLIEQDSALRAVVKRALSRSGYLVLAASNGADGLGLLTQHANQIRVVITNLGIPEIDAPAIARVARELNPDVRIIAVSAFGTSLGQTEKMAALKTIGINRLLTKPWEFDEFLEAVHAELTSIPAPGSGGRPTSAPSPG